MTVFSQAEDTVALKTKEDIILTTKKQTIVTMCVTMCIQMHGIET